jgi:hypothetical protein
LGVIGLSFKSYYHLHIVLLNSTLQTEREKLSELFEHLFFPDK